MASPAQNIRSASDAYTIEEAIALTKCGIFHYELLLTCGLCFLSFMSQVTCVSLILPSVKCDLPGTVQEQAILASASFFGIVCSSHLMGFLGDTWGRIKTLKCSLILSMTFAVISMFSVNMWMLTVTRFLTGFFVAGCQSCTFSLCGEFHSNKTRALHVTLISTFLNLSLITTSLLAILILPLHINWTFLSLNMSPWRFLLLAVNFAPILALILLYRTPETPKYDLIHGNHDKTLKTLQIMFRRNTKRPVEEYPVRNVKLETGGSNITDIHNCRDAVKMIWKQTVQTFYKERILHTLNICFVLSIMYGVSHGLFMWYPTILNDQIKKPNDNLCHVISEIDVSGVTNKDACGENVETLTFWLVTFIGGFFTVIYLVFAFTINIVGKRNELIIWSIICAIFCIAVPWIANLPLAVFALTVISSIGTCGGIVATIAVEFYPTNINAMSICLIMMIGRLGAVLEINLFGLFIFNYCNITFWVVAAVLFVIGFMSWLLPEKKRGDPTTEKQ